MESVFWACWAASYYCLTAEAEAEASFGFEGLWGHWGQGSRGSSSPLSGGSWYTAKISGWFDKGLVTLLHSLEDRALASEWSIEGDKGGRRRMILLIILAIQ